MRGERTGLSLEEPLRTPIHTSTKKITKISKSSKKRKTYKSKNINQRTVTIYQHALNILSTNADGLKHKSEDLKKNINFFNSSIFAVQETHFEKKGKFKITEYLIF